MWQPGDVGIMWLTPDHIACKKWGWVLSSWYYLLCCPSDFSPGGWGAEEWINCVFTKIGLLILSWSLALISLFPSPCNLCILLTPGEVGRQRDCNHPRERIAWNPLLWPVQRERIERKGQGERIKREASIHQLPLLSVLEKKMGAPKVGWLWNFAWSLNLHDLTDLWNWDDNIAFIG